ncbi:hypothetical protein DIPPA_09007 [Diplonema papillatum]|nr:hypothetical protein DIPPA_09007 [Diplonema papillatum]
MPKSAATSDGARSDAGRSEEAEKLRTACRKFRKRRRLLRELVEVARVERRDGRAPILGDIEDTAHEELASDSTTLSTDETRLVRGNHAQIKERRRQELTRLQATSTTHLRRLEYATTVQKATWTKLAKLSASAKQQDRDHDHDHDPDQRPPQPAPPANGAAEGGVKDRRRPPAKEVEQALKQSLRAERRARLAATAKRALARGAAALGGGADDGEFWRAFPGGKAAVDAATELTADELRSIRRRGAPPRRDGAAAAAPPPAAGSPAASGDAFVARETVKNYTCCPPPGHAGARPDRRPVPAPKARTAADCVRLFECVTSDPPAALDTLAALLFSLSAPASTAGQAPAAASDREQADPAVPECTSRFAAQGAHGKGYFYDAPASLFLLRYREIVLVAPPRPRRGEDAAAGPAALRFLERAKVWVPGPGPPRTDAGYAGSGEESDAGGEAAGRRRRRGLQLLPEAGRLRGTHCAVEVSVEFRIQPGAAWVGVAADPVDTRPPAKRASTSENASQPGETPPGGPPGDGQGGSADDDVPPPQPVGLVFCRVAHVERKGANQLLVHLRSPVGASISLPFSCPYCPAQSWPANTGYRRARKRVLLHRLATMLQVANIPQTGLHLPPRRPSDASTNQVPRLDCGLSSHGASCTFGSQAKESFALSKPFPRRAIAPPPPPPRGAQPPGALALESQRRLSARLKAIRSQLLELRTQRSVPACGAAAVRELPPEPAVPLAPTPPAADLLRLARRELPRAVLCGEGPPRAAFRVGGDSNYLPAVRRRRRAASLNGRRLKVVLRQQRGERRRYQTARDRTELATIRSHFAGSANERTFSATVQ